MSEETKIEVIVPEAIVKLDISTGFYQRMQSLLQTIIKGKTKEEMDEAYKQIKERETTKGWINEFETVLIFLGDFQQEAKKHDFVKSMTKDEIDKHLESYKKKMKKD